ncbi:MAG: DNA repair protein RecO [Chloroflexota bacterium]|nr:DNA repair protein RecO [Chloroflexota bacterium]
MNPRLYATEAVVLERRDFGEADRLLTLYTPVHGKVRAIAKGSRRTTSRISGHIELFTHTRLLIASGRNLDIVTQSELIRSHERLRDDLWRAALAYHVAELVNRFSEERLENAQVWRSLLEVLSALDSERAESAALAEMTVRFFELRLLDALGYRPELRICTICGRPLEPVENYYDAGSGGLLCPGCAEGHRLLLPVSVAGVKVLRVLQEGDCSLAARIRLGAGPRREMEQLLRRHIIHVLEHDLLAAHLVDEVRIG